MILTSHTHMEVFFIVNNLRFENIQHNSDKVLDMTSLTLKEFETLLPDFEVSFQERMKSLRLDGKPRTRRPYSTYKNCPLPMPEDRFFFILSYLKSNALQVFHGQLFGMAQCKANVWIHILLPILQDTLKKRGDAPCRHLEELKQQLLVTFPKKQQEAQAVESANLPNGRISQENSAPLFLMTV